MSNFTFKIEGLDCAACAAELEDKLAKMQGVSSASVDFVQSKVVVDCEQSVLPAVKAACNEFEEVRVIEPSSSQEASFPAAEGRRIKIKNLCCANCGRELEEELNAINGVSATVDFMNMTVVLSADSPESYDRAVYAITHFEDVEIDDGKPAAKGLFKSHLKEIVQIALSIIFFIPALVFDFALSGDVFTYIGYAFYGLAFVPVAYPVIWNTLKNLASGKIFDENFLMTVAAVGAIILGIFTGDGLMEGVAVMLLYQIGELLQSVAVGSSRNSISRLMDLKSDTATLVKDGKTLVVAPEDLSVGDIVMIKAGEKVPVDCTLVTGQTSLDMKSLNGEALPREVAEGDAMLSGSINISKVVYARVEREYRNSAVAKILELVENSTARKAAPERFITRFAKYYTPVVVIAALLVASLVPTVICGVQNAFTWPVYRDWIYRSLSFLVISCPCALVISVPLSYFGGIGRAAKFGILVKGSTCLDELARATIAAFDKTGTLTEGVFAVKSFSSQNALQLAAAAEKFSSHPVAAAFAGISAPFEAENAEEIAGRGVKCSVNSKPLVCGNAKLLEEEGIAFTPLSSTSTTIYVAYNGVYEGVIEVDDRIKSDAAEATAELERGGIKHTVMLTGDGKNRAEEVARALGIKECAAALLPDQKLKKAEELKERGGLIYTGDGINDAPVMTVANCAVSMGKVGSDAAIEASDVVLVSDNLSLLPKARRIAAGTRAIVFQNIVGSLVLKFAIMILSVALPSFPLIVAIFGDVGVMLLAILNAMRTSFIK